YNHHGYGAYICGEETALLESLEGKKGMPRYKPPFPASYGLYGKPTTINNTETFAAVPWIITNGGEAFLNLGRPNNGGTKIFSVSCDVVRPGKYELRLGTTVSKLPVKSFIKHFRDEFLHHIEHKKCLVPDYV